MKTRKDEDISIFKAKISLRIKEITKNKGKKEDAG